MNKIDHATINYRDELARKLIHLCSLTIPIVYYFIPSSTASILLGSVAAFALIVDLLRYNSKLVSKIFYDYFGFMLRKHEVDSKKKNLNGATYVLISATICSLLFPKVIFITAFSILIISDTMAALIGRKYGKHKFLAKSFEGTLAFFISAIIVVLVTPKAQNIPVEYIIGIVAAFIGTFVENLSFGIADDNLSIPLSIGVVMLILYKSFNIVLFLQNVPR